VESTDSVGSCPGAFWCRHLQSPLAGTETARGALAPTDTWNLGWDHWPHMLVPAHCPLLMAHCSLITLASSSSSPSFMLVLPPALPLPPAPPGPQVAVIAFLCLLPGVTLPDWAWALRRLQLTIRTLLAPSGPRLRGDSAPASSPSSSSSSSSSPSSSSSSSSSLLFLLYLLPPPLPLPLPLPSSPSSSSSSTSSSPHRPPIRPLFSGRLPPQCRASPHLLCNREPPHPPRC